MSEPRTPSGRVAWFHDAHAHEDENWSGPHATREEAIEQGRLDTVGSFRICEGRKPDPLEMFMTADRLLEDANERANDDCEETDWPDLPKGPMALFRAEYEALIRKHFPSCPFWILDGTIETIRPTSDSAKAAVEGVQS